MIEVLRGWYWWAVCGVISPHVWRLVGDWRDGAMAGCGGKRVWDFCHNDAYDMTGRAGAIKIQCDRCGSRGFGHLRRPTERRAWLYGEPRVWSLVGPLGPFADSAPVTGGPTHEEAKRELG